jgi:hypothetical protein
MTPRVAKRGGSFKGAAAYYLHDKGADTSRRVAFCVTRNLPTEEPELAWRWMAYTDRHAGILKHDAGGARTGPKKRKPVYTLSLSWHAEDRPEPDLMVRMLDSALKKVGLSRCQALYVAHNDTDHPHIHALVSLVDPDTGKIIDPGKDREKLSAWAQAYETERGVIRCHRRVENNARRERGEWVVDHHSKTRQDIEQARQIEREILAARRRVQWDRQVAKRDALKKHAEERSQAIRAQLKERFKPEWAALYKKQRQDERDVKNARRSLLAAMRVAIKERRRLKPDGRAGIGTILAYALSARDLSHAFVAAQERELAELRGRMNEARRAAVKEVWDEYGRDYRALKEAHAEARKNPPQLPPAEEMARRAALEAELAAKAPAAPAQEKPRPIVLEKQGQRPRASQRRDYTALKAVTAAPATPQKSEEERRRETLKAEFRRQAEEIARRRRERKHKDRDRDRER